ncbi:flagellar hook assembly protein FlgD [Segnochrobactrum spirostomi]|uniref:Basal-body rod modification protein FlgD n=1 Tax=Segnochrobactrum spirostomi TaxID=2608987 RepID=A0A6A7Y0Y9_9HYPH|nr:flagellar hook assembly protein FlgD [Segnochrobactrum spirostomi]MQT12740.1 flagellar hook assembly protein FlgD [Segnochrobactrum spirostomi]
MTVSSVTSSTGAASKSSSSTSTSTLGSLNSDTFLKLMLAELKNQDPTSPMDTAQYMSQLASFTQVEQATKTNTKLDTMLSASMIGRTVTSSDGTVSGTVASVQPSSNGVIAKLTNGKSLAIESGVTVS